MFLSTLWPSHREGDVLYVHGSPRNHLNEFVFPEDIYNQKKMEKIGMQFDRVCFNGHTHVPGVFVDLGSGVWQFFAPEECGDEFRIAGQRVLCNVGAVGQPRDGDWRACYVLFDGETIRFQRVEYDVDTTVQKIYAIPELMNFHGDRLREGR